MNVKEMKTSQRSTERVECTICKITFYDKYKLKQHTQYVHGDQTEKFECEICNNEFISLENLNTHKKHILKVMNLLVMYVENISRKRENYVYIKKPSMVNLMDVKTCSNVEVVTNNIL